MARWQSVKSLPDLSQSNCGDEKMSIVLSVVPRDHPTIRPRLSDLTDEIRVQHIVHSETLWTRSGGIRGGSQSVVRRIESYQAFNSCIDWRRLRFRRATRVDDLRARESFSRSESQSSRALASRSDSPLTFLTAISTALIATYHT